MSGMQSVLFLLAFLIARSQAQPHSWDEADCSDKFDECSALVFTDLPDNQQEICSLLNRTIQCFMNYSTHSCIVNSLNAAALKNSAINDFCSRDYCIPGAASVEECSSLFENIITPSPQPVPSQEPPSCDTLPPIFHSGQLVNLGSPSLDLPPSPASPPECTLPDHLTYYRQHCSAFSLSHIRPFGDRSLPLQTCTLFGEWYLLKHESLSVSVLGVPRQSNSDFYDNFYTYISEVNVTLYEHDCFQQTVSYVATGSSLPESIPGLTDPESSPLQLTVEGQSVATILAPWINTSVIIHRIDGYLSVTLQVPEPLSRAYEVGGLCSTGCPYSFDVGGLSLPEYPCTTDKITTAIRCLRINTTYELAQVVLTGSHSYSQLCTYDTLLTHNVTLLSLYLALGEDALRLPDVTTVVTTGEPTTPETTPTSPETTPTVTTPTTRPSIVILTEGSTDFISRGNPSASLLLHTLTLCLLAAVAMAR